MQTHANLRSQITAVIAESCSLTAEELRPDVPLAELGVDSLAIAYTMETLESMLQRKISSDALMKLFAAESVEALVEGIVSLAGSPESVAP